MIACIKQIRRYDNDKRESKVSKLGPTLPTGIRARTLFRAFPVAVFHKLLYRPTFSFVREAPSLHSPLLASITLLSCARLAFPPVRPSSSSSSSSILGPSRRQESPSSCDQRSMQPAAAAARAASLARSTSAAAAAVATEGKRKGPFGMKRKKKVSFIPSPSFSSSLQVGLVLLFPLSVLHSPSLPCQLVVSLPPSSLRTLPPSLPSAVPFVCSLNALLRPFLPPSAFLSGATPSSLGGPTSIGGREGRGRRGLGSGDGRRGGGRVHMQSPRPTSWRKEGGRRGPFSTDESSTLSL